MQFRQAVQSHLFKVIISLSKWTSWWFTDVGESHAEPLKFKWNANIRPCISFPAKKTHCMSLLTLTIPLSYSLTVSICLAYQFLTFQLTTVWLTTRYTRTTSPPWFVLSSTQRNVSCTRSWTAREKTPKDKKLTFAWVVNVCVCVCVRARERNRFEVCVSAATGVYSASSRCQTGSPACVCGEIC